MKGKSFFTRAEADSIIALIKRKVLADKNTQKRLRDKIRKLGFFANDFGIGGGYTVADFLRVAKIIDKSIDSMNQVKVKSTIAKTNKSQLKEKITKTNINTKTYTLLHTN